MQREGDTDRQTDRQTNRQRESARKYAVVALSVESTPADAN